MKKIFVLISIALLISILPKSDDQVIIPSTSIRMRVIAKSNSKEDQKNKIIVKSYLEKIIYEMTKDLKNYEDYDEVVNENKNLIDEYIREAMIKNGIDPVFVSNYGYNYFPEKEFKGISYSSGFYKSYVVTLGEGNGDNWWCVLYPPLCLIDENKDEREYHSLIKDTIEKYN